jgi:hypothetical protein
MPTGSDMSRVAGSVVNPASRSTPEHGPAAPHTEGAERVAPVFVLAAPRSFSSVVASMLGQHPQMYGLPELELFGSATVAEWWELCEQAPGTRSHGMLRAVAQLVFGAQTDATVSLARGWLRRRSHLSSGYLFELLAERVWPCVPVDKSTTYVHRAQTMRQIIAMFPNARFIHLVRHPRGQGESVIKLLKYRQQQGPLPPNHWLLWAAGSKQSPDNVRNGKSSPEADITDVILDPQTVWHTLNSNVCRFLKTVPAAQQLRIRGEDVLTDADSQLGSVCRWLGIDDSAQAIEQMKHPERSPYARLGPTGARFGNDIFFLQDPCLRPTRVQPQSLKGALSWQLSGGGFLPEVKELALSFGYR